MRAAVSAGTYIAERRCGSGNVHVNCVRVEIQACPISRGVADHCCFVNLEGVDAQVQSASFHCVVGGECAPEDEERSICMLHATAQSCRRLIRFEECVADGDRPEAQSCNGASIAILAYSTVATEDAVAEVAKA